MNKKDIADQKIDVRQKIRKKTSLLTQTAISSKSKTICKRMIKKSYFLEARSILVYAAIRKEVVLRDVLREAMRVGKKIYFPKVNRSTKKLELYYVRDLEKDLCKGYLKIPEPRAFKSRRAPLSQIDLALIPGVAFSRKGARLGRGGGFYDQLLRRSKKTMKVGVCFKEQVLKSIPMTKKDILVDEVVTD